MDHTRPSADLAALRDFLYVHLRSDVIPFWLRHAIDPDGGLNTCITDDGHIVSRDKWLWSQWRAVWVFSKLYNRIAPRPEWLDTARHIYQFAARHGWDEHAQGWVLRLAHDGSVQAGYDSLYVDGFAIYGCVEFAKATREQEPLDLAVRTADALLARLETTPHDRIPHFPYPVPPGARVHGIPMIFSLVLWELGQLSGLTRFAEAGLAMADEVLQTFYRKDVDLIVERISADGSPYPPPMGTTVIPGHGIEGMWFQIHIARDRNDAARIAECCRLIRRHVEAGWDHEHGGLFQAIDLHGASDVGWKLPDAKLWWPQTEAMYALLLAYEHTREDWCLQWYDRVHHYAITHYPVAPHGEWTQRLDRLGRPITDVIALPVKDPFHLPRALIYCLDTLDRLANSK